MAQECSIKPRTRPGIKLSMLGRAAQLGGANRARAIGSCHRASRTEHAQPPSRAEQTLRSVRLLGVTHKYMPTHISARFMYATHILSQSEASNAWAGRGSMAGHSRPILLRDSLPNQ